MVYVVGGCITQLVFPKLAVVPAMTTGLALQEMDLEGTSGPCDVSQPRVLGSQQLYTKSSVQPSGDKMMLLLRMEFTNQLEFNLPCAALELEGNGPGGINPERLHRSSSPRIGPQRISEMWQGEAFREAILGKIRRAVIWRYEGLTCVPET